ncbi:hypothetical protein D3C73_912550 [compost metagenome]
MWLQPLLKSGSLEFTRGKNQISKADAEVQDNGLGAEHLQEGFGLTAMKERALIYKDKYSLLNARRRNSRQNEVKTLCKLEIIC